MADPLTKINSETASIWYLYIVENRLGHWYTGITTDPERRFAEHQASGKKTAKALRGKGPLVMRYCQPMESRRQASQMEYQLKQLTKAEKRRFVNGQLSLPGELTVKDAFIPD